MMHKTTKKIISAALCLGILISLCSCANVKNFIFNGKSEPGDTTVTQSTAPTSTTAPETTQQAEESDFSLNNYDYLSNEEKDVYNQISAAVSNGLSTIDETLEDFNAEIFDRIFFYSFLVDNPQYFNVRANSSSWYNTGTKQTTARFDIKYIYTDERYNAKMDKINGIAKQLKASLSDNADDFAKAKAIYDYIIDNCEYDNDYTGESLKEKESTASCADGALLEHKAVCTGYSRAFKLLANKLGIDCTCIENGEHEWNLVKLEGNFYHIDVTWGDNDYDRYKYFCLSDAQISKDHKMPDYTIPECNINYNL